MDQVQTAIKEQARRFPTEDRLLLIKVLEGEQDFAYKLEAGAWLRINGAEVPTESQTFDSVSVKLCEAKSRAMCVVGALVAAKLPNNTRATKVARYSNSYANRHGINASTLDALISLQKIPQFIEELRRLEVEEN